MRTITIQIKLTGESTNDLAVFSDKELVEGFRCCARQGGLNPDFEITLVPGWQAIESAPKTGEKILLHNKCWARVFEGGWHRSTSLRKDDFKGYVGSSQYGSFLPRCDYWGYGLDNVQPFCGAYTYWESQPTHWQPFPQPPTESKADE